MSKLQTVPFCILTQNSAGILQMGGQFSCHFLVLPEWNKWGLGIFLSEKYQDRNEIRTCCCPFVGLIITGSWDSTIKLWDPRQSKSVGTYNQPGSVSFSVTFLLVHQMQQILDANILGHSEWQKFQCLNFQWSRIFEVQNIVQ